LSGFQASITIFAIRVVFCEKTFWDWGHKEKISESTQVTNGWKPHIYKTSV